MEKLNKNLDLDSKPEFSVRCFYRLLSFSNECYYYCILKQNVDGHINLEPIFDTATSGNIINSNCLVKKYTINYWFIFYVPSSEKFLPLVLKFFEPQYLLNKKIRP